MPRAHGSDRTQRAQLKPFVLLVSFLVLSGGYGGFYMFGVFFVSVLKKKQDPAARGLYWGF